MLAVGRIRVSYEAIFAPVPGNYWRKRNSSVQKETIPE